MTDPAAPPGGHPPATDPTADAIGGAPCPHCNAAMTPGFPRCGTCGGRVARENTDLDTGRVATLVVSDLKGSTALGERFDAETLREVLGRYFDEMRLVFEGHGGRIQKIIGDAIISVFGFPTPRPDDPVRAVRAVLEAEKTLERLNEQFQAEWGVQLVNRTGVCTGHVLVGEAMAGQHVLMGDTMDVATAMEQNAPALGALLAAPTYELVKDLVEVEPVGLVHPKGEPDRLFDAFHLLGQRDGALDALVGELGGDGLARRALVRCLHCGQDSPSSFTFCGWCGTPASASSAVAQDTRRMVTVVFCDPKPHADDGSPIPNEVLTEVLSAFFDEVRQILEQHGGTVEKFIGDAVMAVFGLPVRHEDDALRAVRAAEAMRDALPRINAVFSERWGVTMGSPTGVNTGEVVAGDAALAQRLVTGDTVNVAARLEQNAGMGEVLLGNLTYRLVRDDVEAEAVEPLTLKGKAERVPAFRLGHVRGAAEEGAGRRLDAPMVGRERELAQLHQTLVDAVLDRRAHHVTIFGDAGVGKTRLTREFLNAAGARGARVLRGRCLSYGDGITFWPLALVVRDAAGIVDDDTPDAAREKIRSLVGDAAVYDRLASVSGLSDEAFPVAELFWGARRFLEILGKEQPVVVRIDDVHWAEPTFLQLLRQVVGSVEDAAVVLVCTARTDLLDDDPNWASGEREARVMLAPLTKADAEKVVENLLGDAGIDEAVRVRIASAAEGNPLFVEQLLSMLIDEGSLRFRNGRWVAAGGLESIKIPPTINALLAARIDAVPSTERRVLEAAAVVGLQFERESLVALAADGEREQVPVLLTSLVDRQLVQQGGDEESYKFQNQLIRDVAYGGLLKRSRAQLHERFVEWAEDVNRARDREIEFEEILGYHLEQAYTYRSQLGPLDSHGVGLGLRAADRLSSAGQRALARGDMPAASGLFRRSSGVLPENDTRRPLLLLRSGESLMEMGRFGPAQETLATAEEVAASMDDRGVALTARTEQIRLRYLSEGNVDAVTHVNEALPVLEALGDHPGLARAWRLLTYVDLTACQFAKAERSAQQMIEHARAAGDRIMAIRVLPALAGIIVHSPTPVDDAIRQAEELLAQTGSDRRAEAVTLRALAHLRAMRGEFEEARTLYRRARRTLTELGWHFNAALVSIDSGPIELMAGDAEAAERELRRDYDTLDAMQERNYISTTAAYLGEALFRQGRIDEAEKMADFSQEVAASDDLFSQVLWRGVKAKVLAHRGALGRAVEVSHDAIAVAEQTDDVNQQADAYVDRAEVLHAAGLDDEAVAALDDAIRRYEAKGNVVSAAHARARREELS